MRPHEVYLHLGVLDSVPKTGPAAEKDHGLHLQFAGASGNPRRLYRARRLSLRERQIKIVGDYAVTYWLDVPVQIVMVVDIRLAGR